MIDNKKEYIECDCGSHFVLVSSFKDTEPDYVSHEFYFNMFDMAVRYKVNWKWRIKTAWNILKSGSMHEDQVILRPDEAKKLADFINKNL